jgi:hypothetical protein
VKKIVQLVRFIPVYCETAVLFVLENAFPLNTHSRNQGLQCLSIAYCVRSPVTSVVVHPPIGCRQWVPGIHVRHGRLKQDKYQGSRDDPYDRRYGYISITGATYGYIPITVAESVIGLTFKWSWVDTVTFLSI